ncbi:sensor histidine kinase [Pedobacter sp. ASV28]|uniref:sensor histidine kinase n=1 Tax=Pedobacter sp. ASV28 TaxID=2795123 RepID=UPI0018ED6775|nr:histidine kinase [Pedobacter sp. ASV28]
MISKRFRKFPGKILMHVLFWLIIISLLTLLFPIGEPGYWMALNVMLISVVCLGLFIKFIWKWYKRKQSTLHAQLNFLKAQVHPHFLFNTLNNLYALTLDQSPKSSQAVLGLSEILRYMLYECNADQVLLKRDIEILKSYISLEKLRYDENLDLNITITTEISDQKIAPLLIMPLVENAFKHGASEMMEAAWISIVLEIDEQHLKVKVSNSCPAQPQQPGNGAMHFNKIGMSNLRNKLELIYPGNHSLNIHHEADIYMVIMEIYNINQL